MSTAALRISHRGSSREARPLRRDFTYTLRLLVPYLAFILSLFAGKPALLRPLFPATTLMVGYFLYRRNESYFLSFVLWIYMLSPLLRRLVDWRTSYQEQSLILLAPLVITLIPAMDLRRRLLTAAPVIRTAALLAFGAIAFGAGVGMIKHPGVPVILATVTWTAPIVLCVFAATIRERDILGRVLTRTFLFGALILSLYGLYQFAVAPPWDTYWLKLISAGEAATSPSFGQPKPYGIRVWSTMNAPGPLGALLSVAIVWLTPCDSAKVTIVLLLSYVSLLLTMARGMWIQTAFGVALLIVGCRPRMSFKGLGVLLLIFGLLWTGLQEVPQAADVRQRFSTFGSLGTDASANERREMYHYLEGLILTSPMGEGLDTTYQVHEYPLDSSLLILFYMTGWLGAVCYLGAIGLIATNMLSRLRDASRYRVAAAAIGLSCMTQVGSGDVILRQGGVLLWLFVGIWASLTFPLQRRTEVCVTSQR